MVKASGLVILFSGGLLLTCALAIIVRGKSLRLSALRPSRLTLVVSLIGAVGALLSSVVLYVSYRPYAEILQRFIRNGDETSLTELSSFLGTTQLPLGAQGFLEVFQFGAMSNSTRRVRADSGKSSSQPTSRDGLGWDDWRVVL